MVKLGEALNTYKEYFCNETLTVSYRIKGRGIPNILIQLKFRVKKSNWVFPG